MKLVWLPVVVITFISTGFAADNPVVPSEGSSAETPLLLRYQPKAGSKYSTQFDFNQEGAAVFGRMKLEFRQTISALYDTHVLKTDPESTTLHIYFKVLRMQMSDGYTQSTFDSSRPKRRVLIQIKPREMGAVITNLDDSYSPVLDALAGQSVTCKVSSQGKILEIAGLEKVVKRIVVEPQTIPDFEVHESPPSMTGLPLYRSLTTDLVRKMIGSVSDQTLISQVYSKEPVKTGARWTANEMTGDKTELVQTSMSFNLQSRTKDVATIALYGLAFEPYVPERDGQMASNSWNSGQMHGSMRVEEASGRVLSVSIKNRSLAHQNDPLGSEFGRTITYGKGTLTVKILGN